MKKAKLIAVLGMAFAIVVLVPASHANTLIYTPTPVGVGQTSVNPCVIGDPSCNASVTAADQLTYTSNAGPCGGGLCDFTSPVYVAGLVTATPITIPLTFTVGVDENYAAGKGDEILTFFKLFSCTNGSGSSCSVLDSTSGTNDLVPENNGNGKSDGILTGFSTLTSGNYYKFEASWSNDTDGMEQFWLIPGTATATPEPGTIALLGMGLVGLLGLSLSRKQVSA